MGSREPRNITKMLQQNAERAAAREHASGLQKASHTAQWHEKKLKIGTQTSAHLKANDVSKDAKNEIASELQSAEKELKVQRRERLLQLYQQEALQYEQELNGMGLAISKARS